MTGRKLFSLLSGKQVHITDAEKRIPASEFSIVQSAAELIDTVKQEAEQYRMDIVSECEKMHTIAQREGFEEGFAKWVEQISLLEQERKALQRAMEKTIIPVALKAARKIVSREIELNEDTVVSIISEHLKSVAQHKKVVIFASKEDVAILERHREELKKVFEHIESLSIQVKDKLSRGSFTIETDKGIMDAQLEQMWEVLEKFFIPKS